MRLHVPTPTAPGLLRRVLLPLTAALLIGAGLATPAAAEPVPAAPPAAPVVTPSTTEAVAVGAPMTMTISPGSADSVHGYAWTWHPSPSGPVYSGLPACGTNDATSSVRFVCGSTVTLRVSPPHPVASFTAWAFDASGNRSAKATVEVDTTYDVEALHRVTHQWTTSQGDVVPPAADCAPGPRVIDCLPDTAGVDALHPQGDRPLLLPPGVTPDGVLTFRHRNRLPAATLGAVVDTRQGFTVGGWLTTTATGVPATAIAQTGSGGAGFELGVTAGGQWQLRARSASGTAVATAPNPTTTGIPVYVAGVADAGLGELRLYVNGELVAVDGFTPARGGAFDGPVTVGGRPALTGISRPWVGQIGNPVVAQAPLPRIALSALATDTFFWTESAD